MIIYKTKYLTFSTKENEGSRIRKTSIISVINNSSEDELGTIEWYSSWRQYCFMPTFEFSTVFNNTCLIDIITVIDKLMKARKVDK